MGATSGSSLQGSEARVAARSKEAGALVYLVEELGDARMRCDQLLRYVDRATKLIEKSSHKDHFFEVAGDVIRGIPETSFKLHKALQAVALAANRIDYEEIKQDLRPEKAEELERVLEDVRVRQVQRRSLPMLNPGNVVEQLRGLAKQARENGRLDTDSLGSLIAALEGGAPKVAEGAGAKAAAQLEAMVQALENPPAGEMPSRVRLAQVLRKTLAEHLDVRETSPKLAAEQWAPNIARVLVLGSKELKDGAASFEDGRDQYAWQCLHVAVGRIRQVLHMAKKKDTTARKLMAELMDIAVAADVGIRTAADGDEKQSRFEEGKSADPTENMSEEDAKAWKENTDEYGDKFKKDAKGELMLPPSGLSTFSAIDAATSIEGVIVSLKQLHRMLTSTSSMRAGSISLAFKEAIVELGAAAWHLNLPDLSEILEKARLKTRIKSVERVAAEGDPQPRSIEELETTLESLLGNARLTRTFGQQGNYKKVLFNLMKVIGDVYTVTNIFDIPGTGFLARVVKAIVPYSGARPMLNFAASLETTADGDEKRSRFEEGKSADPTKNMSDADAKAWKENTEEYKDKFKSASNKVAKKIPAPDDSSIIDEIMSWHGGQGTRLYSVGSSWNAGRPVEADDAEEAYDELKRKRADRDALDAFEEHLSQHGVKVAGHNYQGKMYVKYVRAGQKRKEGPFDQSMAKRRLVALMEDASVTHLEFERHEKRASAEVEDWKAA